MHYDEQAEEWEARQRKGGQSPAPAWTREAPKSGPGFYWVRYDRHELLVAEFVVESESSYWLTSGDLEEDPVDKYEHWPVRLEPPQ